MDYEVDVYFWGDYDDALGKIAVRPSSFAEAAGWAGKPVRAGLEGANRRREMDDGSEDAKSFRARRDVLRWDIQHSTRESGPRSRCRPGDAATVRSATQFGQQAELSEISGQSNGTERTTDMTIVKQLSKEAEAALQKAYGIPVIVFGLKPPVPDKKKSKKPVETKDPEKK